MNTSLSVVVPAFNEQDNISQAIDGIHQTLDGIIKDYEIIVVDDGSKDRTLPIAQEKARQSARVTVISNDQNRGFGYSYRRGVECAQKEYVTVCAGDNEGSWESFKILVANMQKADIVSLYTQNLEDRPWSRQILSKTFTALMNLLFSMHMKYFNGLFTCRRELLQSVAIRSQGLTALAECKVRLIKQGHSYVEIPSIYVPRSGGRSSALSLKSIKAVLQAVGCLFWDIYWGKK